MKNAVKYAKDRGITVNFGSEVEFYLFRTDEKGDPTKQPFDYAGYMDIAPEDRGENVRREICFTLIEMGIQPEASHHEEGPGQNEIDFHYSDALTAADNTSTFKWVVKTAAMGNGLYADFSPKPIREQAGSGMHVNMSVCSDDGKDYTDEFMSGIMAHVREMTLFLNPCENSYERLGERKAPGYITWSPQNRSQLIRIPASGSGQKRIELRSPDPMANPYLAYALLIYAGMDGIEKKMPVPEPMNINLYKADPETVSGLAKLPQNFGEAYDAARNSRFIREILPDAYLDAYKKR